MAWPLLLCVFEPHVFVAVLMLANKGFWMSDRPRTQQRLANDLADLVAVCHDSNRVAFLRAFWATMAKNWTKIDVLR
jgi:hypothetical protein